MDSKEVPELKILVVEDNLADFQLMEQAMKRAFPCNVELVTSKSDYENHLASAKPDVIISDSNLITFDGMTALEIARHKFQDIPFIFCCGFFSNGVMKDAAQKGIPCILKDKGYLKLTSYIQHHLVRNGN